jgi:hypothetical protein
MPTFTHKRHATAVNDELSEAILGLDKMTKKRLSKSRLILMEHIMKKAKRTTSEGIRLSHLRGCVPGPEVGPSPSITMTTKHAA